MRSKLMELVVLPKELNNFQAVYRLLAALLHFEAQEAPSMPLVLDAAYQIMPSLKGSDLAKLLVLCAQVKASTKHGKSGASVVALVTPLVAAASKAMDAPAVTSVAVALAKTQSGDRATWSELLNVAIRRIHEFDSYQLVQLVEAVVHERISNSEFFGVVERRVAECAHEFETLQLTTLVHCFKRMSMPTGQLLREVAGREVSGGVGGGGEDPQQAGFGDFDRQSSDIIEILKAFARVSKTNSSKPLPHRSMNRNDGDESTTSDGSSSSEQRQDTILEQYLQRLSDAELNLDQVLELLEASVRRGIDHPALLRVLIGRLHQIVVVGESTTSSHSSTISGEDSLQILIACSKAMLVSKITGQREATVEQHLTAIYSVAANSLNLAVAQEKMMSTSTPPDQNNKATGPATGTTSASSDGRLLERLSLDEFLRVGVALGLIADRINTNAGDKPSKAPSRWPDAFAAIQRRLESTPELVQQLSPSELARFFFVASLSESGRRLAFKSELTLLKRAGGLQPKEIANVIEAVQRMALEGDQQQARQQPDADDNGNGGSSSGGGDGSTTKKQVVEESPMIVATRIICPLLKNVRAKGSNWTKNCSASMVIQLASAMGAIKFRDAALCTDIRSVLRLSHAMFTPEDLANIFVDLCKVEDTLEPDFIQFLSTRILSGPPDPHLIALVLYALSLCSHRGSALNDALARIPALAPAASSSDLVLVVYSVARMKLLSNALLLTLLGDCCGAKAEKGEFSLRELSSLQISFKALGVQPARFLQALSKAIEGPLLRVQGLEVVDDGGAGESKSGDAKSGQVEGEGEGEGSERLGKKSILTVEDWTAYVECLVHLGASDVSLIRPSHVQFLKQGSAVEKKSLLSAVQISSPTRVGLIALIGRVGSTRDAIVDELLAPLASNYFKLGPKQLTALIVALHQMSGLPGDVEPSSFLNQLAKTDPALHDALRLHGKTMLSDPNAKAKLKEAGLAEAIGDVAFGEAVVNSNNNNKKEKSKVNNEDTQGGSINSGAAAKGGTRTEPTVAKQPPSRSSPQQQPPPSAAAYRGVGGRLGRGIMTPAISKSGKAVSSSSISASTKPLSPLRTDVRMTKPTGELQTLKPQATVPTGQPTGILQQRIASTDTAAAEVLGTGTAQKSDNQQTPSPDHPMSPSTPPTAGPKSIASNATTTQISDQQEKESTPPSLASPKKKVKAIKKPATTSKLTEKARGVVGKKPTRPKQTRSSTNAQKKKQQQQSSRRRSSPSPPKFKAKTHRK
jgi:hypothetical protein